MMACYVYLLRAGPYAKVGIADNIGRRVRQLQTACPERITVYSSKWVCCRSHAAEIEADFHRDLTRAGYHTSGEWFGGDAIVESWFEVAHGHKVSFCCDVDLLEDIIREFIGVPLTWFDQDFALRADSLPVGRDISSLAPPSIVEGQEEKGYTFCVTGCNTPILVTGWYVRSGDTVCLISFDGTWSECSLERLSKATRDEQSAIRNIIGHGWAYQLPARCES